MQESQNTKVAKVGRFLKILWNNLNGLFSEKAGRIPYQSYSDVIDMNRLDNGYDILKDKLVKKSSCSICL